MANKTRKSTERKLAEGYGQGEGSNYKPFIKVHEFSSKGRVTRRRSMKSARTTHTFSDIESRFAIILEYSPFVIEYYEQKNLDMTETMQICEELGIDHNKNEQGNIVPFTTDFYIKLNDGSEIARSVKSNDDLVSTNTLRKLEVERLYWESKGVNWAIVADIDINRTMCENLGFFYQYCDLTGIKDIKELDDEQLEVLISEVYERFVDSNDTFNKICAIMDRDYAFTIGTTAKLFRYLVWNGLVVIDLKKRFDPNSIVEILNTSDLFDEYQNENTDQDQLDYSENINEIIDYEDLE